MYSINEKKTVQTGDPQLRIYLNKIALFGCDSVICEKFAVHIMFKSITFTSKLIWLTSAMMLGIEFSEGWPAAFVLVDILWLVTERLFPPQTDWTAGEATILDVLVPSSKLPDRSMSGIWRRIVSLILTEFVSKSPSELGLVSKCINNSSARPREYDSTKTHMSKYLKQR